MIDNSMVTFANATLDGAPASVLKPIPEMIRILRDQVFMTGGPVGPLAQGDPAALVRADAARIRVVNDTYTADLDVSTANFLAAQGMQVTERGVPTGDSAQTMLIVFSPKLYALRYLVSTFGITSSNQIIMKPDTTAAVDIEIRIGEDWVAKLPTGY